MLQIKYHDIGTDTLNNKSHLHRNDFEILHILSGEGTIMIKDELYELNSNTVVFIEGSDTHYTSPKFPKQYIRNKIIFPYEKVMELAKTMSAEDIIERLFLNGGAVISVDADSSDKIDRCFYALSKLSQSDAQKFNINLFINIFTILNVAVTNADCQVKNIKNKISEVISFLNKNLHNKLTLDLICEEINVSKYYLCKIFKNTVGMTIFKYVEYLRISRSKELLIKTDLSISDISQKVGFESFAYFSKVFKKHEKCTPSRYRKNLVQEPFCETNKYNRGKCYF